MKTTIIAAEGRGCPLDVATGADLKGKISVLIYVIAIPVAMVRPGIAAGIYGGVALLWLVPDRRIERHVNA